MAFTWVTFSPSADFFASCRLCLRVACFYVIFCCVTGLWESWLVCHCGPGEVMPSVARDASCASPSRALSRRSARPHPAWRRSLDFVTVPPPAAAPFGNRRDPQSRRGQSPPLAPRARHPRHKPGSRRPGHRRERAFSAGALNVARGGGVGRPGIALEPPGRLAGRMADFSCGFLLKLGLSRRHRCPSRKLGAELGVGPRGRFGNVPAR